MLNKILVLAGMVFLSTYALAQGGLRYTIQVTKFENKAGYSAQWSLGDAWGAVLTDKLQETGKFIVVAERDMRQAAMDEQDFAESGRVAGGKKAPKVGHMTPAQLLVKGVITDFSDGTSREGVGGSYKGVGIRLKRGKAKITGTVYVVDSTTGQVVDSQKFEAELKLKGLKLRYANRGFHGDVGGFRKTPAGKAMDMAAADVAEYLVGKTEVIPWTGTVVKGGQRIIINRGNREGVSQGDIFLVGRSEEIRDPDTGELLDTDFMETGRIRVTNVKEKLSYCSLESGKSPARGDTIFQK